MKKELIFQQVAHFWSLNMPFNELLGFKIHRFESDESEIRFAWQDKLIGNPVQKILHGGVTASALDLAGGVVAAANIIEQLDDLSFDSIQKSLSRLSTIDMRTDYLRPGRGEEFFAYVNLDISIPNPSS